MSTVRLMFDSAVEGLAGVQVPAELIDARLMTRWRGALTIGSSNDIDVEPGVYAARAYLPSGEMIQADLDVESDQTMAVDLALERNARDQPVGISDLLGSQPPSHTTAPASPGGLAFDIHQSRAAGTSRFVRLWIRGGNEWRAAESPAFEAAGPQSVRVRLAISGEQQLLQVGGIQTPWRFFALPPGGPGRATEVWVNPGSGESAMPAEVAISSGNQSAEALLRFLSGGSIRQAAVVSEAVVGADVTAEELLMGKVADPAAAAIGAYYLLRIGELQRLHDWARNLATWIDWMADGSVIYAWQLLKSPKPDVSAARGQLLDAERRGLPIYTEGLRLLFDGLKLFDLHASSQDSDVSAALRRVAAYADAADWTMPTTAFGGTHPSQPSSIPRLGLPEDDEPFALLGDGGGPLR